MTPKKKILLVDDDIDILEQVAGILAESGYDVTTAESEEEGEEKLLSFQPDIAVFDLMMERMDSGFVLCHRAKRLYPKMPVVVLTAVTAATGMDFHPMEGGGDWVKANLLLDKPVRKETLLYEIEKLLGK